MPNPIKILTLLLIILSAYHPISAYDDISDKYSVNGYVKDAKSGEDLIGASIYIRELQSGTTTNAYGFYSLTLPKGTYTLVVTYIGFGTIEKTIELNAGLTMNFNLEDASVKMAEIVVSERNKDENVQSVKMSSNLLTMEQMKKVPALFGEVDVIKNIQRLPGVQSVGEGTTSFYVRGGSTDQNLILLDEAPVYNPSHLIGIFSTFNSDAIKSAEIFKGGIPAQYGGRLSSVVDIRSRDGNMKKITGTASIGLLSAKATLEGPIKKDRGSFIISGRRSYMDIFLLASSNPDLKKTSVYFFDLNVKLNYILTKKDRIFIAGYFGEDVFGNKSFGINWGNSTGTIRWNHVFNNRLFSNTTGIFSNYSYGLGSPDTSQSNAFDWQASIKEYSLKQDFTYFLNPSNEIKFGVQATLRTFQPGKIVPIGDNSIFKLVQMPMNHAIEHAYYISNDQKLSPMLTLQYGLRFTVFHNNGTRVYSYTDNIPDKDNITDTTNYSFWQIAQTYTGLEPRFGARFAINEHSSVKVSYNRTYQYMHMLSNSAAPLPFTMWLPSGKYISPQSSDQVAIGYFRNFLDNKLEASVETYYKWLNNTVDYKDNAQLLLNETIEADVLRGKGWAYGAEFSLSKTVGRTQGSVSYTLSWTELQIPGINNGNPYYAPWDRRHNINMNISHEINDRWSIGAAWTFGTGRPVTLPVAQYHYDYTSVVYYNGRNGERTPVFHRLDLSLNYKPKPKPGSRIRKQWNFSVYNAYYRQNPFSVFTRNVQVQDPAYPNDPGKTIATTNKEIAMTWFFPILPSFTYTINF